MISFRLYKRSTFSTTKVTQTSLLSDAAAQLTDVDAILSQSGAVTQKHVSGSSIPNNLVNTPFDLYKKSVQLFATISLEAEHNEQQSNETNHWLTSDHSLSSKDF